MVECTLAARPAEEHLCVGPHECDRNLGMPGHLALNDWPFCLPSSLSSFNLGLLEEVELCGDGWPPRADNRECRRKEGGTRGLDSRSVHLGLGLVAKLAKVVTTHLEDLFLVLRRSR